MISAISCVCVSSVQWMMGNAVQCAVRVNMMERRPLVAIGRKATDRSCDRCDMLRFSGSSQNPGSSVLDELQLSNGLLWKTGEETISIIHPAGVKGMNKFLQVLTGNKTSNSCNVFEMIVC